MKKNLVKEAISQPDAGERLFIRNMPKGEYSMKKNSVKQKLAQGLPVFGAFQGFNSPNIVEMFGQAGFDFIILDCEHGHMNPGSCENLVGAAEITGMIPIVRN